LRVGLAQIIQRSAHLLGVRIDDEGAVELAARSRGARHGLRNRVLRPVRDSLVNEARQ
jgi:Holliday junction DNA helicase RuvB